MAGQLLELINNVLENEAIKQAATATQIHSFMNVVVFYFVKYNVIFVIIISFVNNSI